MQICNYLQLAETELMLTAPILKESNELKHSQ
jgi:hypothetical protein